MSLTLNPDLVPPSVRHGFTGAAGICSETPMGVAVGDLDSDAKGSGAREKDPNGLPSGTPGAKLDAGKSPVMQGAFQYFPRAIRAVADLSAKGAKKYSWKGWEKVPDGINRYGDAMARHILDEAENGLYDDKPGGSNELHATAIAWNALARLELLIKQIEENGTAHG